MIPISKESIFERTGGSSKMEISIPKRITSSRWRISIIYSLLFLFAVGFLDLSGIIISGTLLLCFLFFPKTKIDSTCLTMLLFGVFYLLSLYMYDVVTVDRIIKFLLLPAGTYYIGFTLAEIDKRGGTTYRLATVLVMGFYIHALLNMSSFIQINGVDFSLQYRRAYEFWKDNLNLSVTVCNLYSAPMAGYALGVMFSHKSIQKKFLSAIALITVIFTMMLYQNRTTVAVIAIIVGITFVGVFFKYGLQSKMLWFLLFVSLGVAIILINDIWGFRTFLFGTSLFERLQGDPNSASRTEIWFSFLMGEWWKYPLGGKGVTLAGNSGSYVHNLWLDTWWNTGFVPFVLLFGFTIKLIVQSYGLLRRRIQDDYKSLIVVYLIGGLLLNFCVEPVLEANPFVFYVLTFLSGSMQCETLSMNRSFPVEHKQRSLLR